MPTPAATAVPRARPSRASAVARGLAIVGAAVTVPLDGWLLWRDLRPVPGRVEVEGLIAGHRDAEAERALREVLRRSPHDGEAMVQLARALGGQGRYVESASALRGVPEWWPTKATAAFWEASSWKLARRMRDAEAAWRRAIRVDPMHPVAAGYRSAAVLELIELMAEEERWDDAHAIIWEAYDQADPAEHAHILGIWMRTRMERLDPAATLPVLRGFLDADPGDRQARLAIARAEQAVGNTAGALGQVDACLRDRPDDPVAWRERLAILHAQGDLGPLLRAVGSLPPSTLADPDCWKYRGLAAERGDDWAGAADAYRRAVELRPSEAEFHYRLATAEDRLGHPGAAVEHRRENQALRAARAALPEAYQDYRDATKDRQPGRPTRAESLDRLARLCDELGWTRAADGWRSLID